MGSGMPPEMMVICLSCKGDTVDYATVITEPCAECEGVGELDEIPCPTCDGEGCPRCFQEGSLYNLLCPLCDGFGEQDRHPNCRDCNGSGWHPHPGFME